MLPRLDPPLHGALCPDWMKWVEIPEKSIFSSTVGVQTWVTEQKMTKHSTTAVITFGI